MTGAAAIAAGAAATNGAGAGINPAMLLPKSATKTTNVTYKQKQIAQIKRPSF